MKVGSKDYLKQQQLKTSYSQVGTRVMWGRQLPQGGKFKGAQSKYVINVNNR